VVINNIRDEINIMVIHKNDFFQKRTHINK